MIFILDRNYDVLGVLSNASPDATPFYDDLFTERVDGRLSLEFSVPYNSDIAQSIVVETHVIYKTTEGKCHLFRIMEVGESSKDNERLKHCSCENTAIGDLTRTIVRPSNPVTQTYSLKSLINSLLSGTAWSLGFIDIPDSQTQSYTIDSYTNVFQEIQKAVSLWIAEPEFIVFMDGLKIKKKVINFYAAKGESTNATFTYGVDLKEVQRTVQSMDVCTAVVAIGAADENKNRLTITGATDPLFPQFQSDFVRQGDMLYSKWALQTWGMGQQKVRLLDKSDVTDANVLLKFAQQELEKYTVPSISYVVDIITLKEYSNGFEENKPVGLGDTILIIDTCFKPEIRLNARIIERHLSWTKAEENKVILGDFLEVIQSAYQVTQNLQKTMNNSKVAWNGAINRINSGVISNANGTSGIKLNTMDIKTADGQNSAFKIDGATGKTSILLPTSDSSFIVQSPSGDKEAIMNIDQTGASFGKVTATQLKVASVLVGGSFENIPYYDPVTGEFQINNNTALQTVLSLLPKYIYKRVVLRLKTDVTGDLNFDGFYGGGELVVAFDTFNIYGSIRFFRCTCRVGVSASTGKINATPSNLQVGNINSDAAIQFIGCPEAEVYGLKIYGFGSYQTYGIKAHFSNIIIGSCEIFNCKTAIALRQSRAVINSCKGKGQTGGWGVYAYDGSQVEIINSAPSGVDGTSGTNRNVSAGSFVNGSTTVDAGTPSVPSTPNLTRQVLALNGRSWRSGAWRTDTTDVIQGAWAGSALNSGAWFFDTGIWNLIKTKTIVTMKIYLSRKPDAGYGTSTLVLNAHTINLVTDTLYSTPYDHMYCKAGDTTVSVSFDRGESKWVDITALAKYFNTAGNSYAYPAKGIGIYTPSSADVNYVRMLQDATVEVTYY